MSGITMRTFDIKNVRVKIIESDYIIIYTSYLYKFLAHEHIRKNLEKELEKVKVE
jgi:hypothetical protein